MEKNDDYRWIACTLSIWKVGEFRVTDSTKDDLSALQNAGTFALKFQKLNSAAGVENYFVGDGTDALPVIQIR